MKIKTISFGTKKAEIIVMQATEYGLVCQTRHLLLQGSTWRDNLKNKYTFDGNTFKMA